MRKLNTRTLELFAAVATCLNFRQAAERLHMTQPPLSRAVRQLEERLGTRLFERDTQGVALTPAGARLLPHAQRILAALDEAEQDLDGARAGAGPLRLGLTIAVEPGLFRPLAAALPQPPVVTTDSSPRLVAALRAGRLDAAIVGLPTNTFELHVEKLGTQPMIAALPSAHPLARRRQVRLSDLTGEPVFWIERARQPAFFDHSHRVFARHGCMPRFLREPRDHHVLLEEVSAGAGIALLPASFAALRRNGVRYRPLAEGGELAVGLGLATATDHPALPALRKAARASLGRPE